MAYAQQDTRAAKARPAPLCFAAILPSTLRLAWLGVRLAITLTVAAYSARFFLKISSAAGLLLLLIPKGEQPMPPRESKAYEYVAFTAFQPAAGTNKRCIPSSV